MVNDWHKPNLGPGLLLNPTSFCKLALWHHSLSRLSHFSFAALCSVIESAALCLTLIKVRRTDFSGISCIVGYNLLSHFKQTREKKKKKKSAHPFHTQICSDLVCRLYRFSGVALRSVRLSSHGGFLPEYRVQLLVESLWRSPLRKKKHPYEHFKTPSIEFLRHSCISVIQF